MMEHIIRFGGAEIRVIGVFLLNADKRDYALIPTARAVAERTIFVDISMKVTDGTFLVRAGALPLVTSTLSLLSEIGVAREVNLAIGDGEFNIRGQSSDGLFDLILGADRDLTLWRCSRDQLALFLCNLVHDIDSVLRTEGVSLDELLRKFPVLP